MMMETIQELVKQKRTTLIAMLILLAVTILVYVVREYYIVPHIQSSRLHNDELQRKSALEGNADSATVFRRGTEDLKAVVGRIPVKRQFPQLVGEINEMVSSSSLKNVKMSYKPQILKEENLLAYSLSLAVNGRYAAIKSFMADLQAKHELIVIENATFANEDPFEESITMSLMLTVYLRNQEGV